MLGPGRGAKRETSAVGEVSIGGISTSAVRELLQIMASFIDVPSELLGCCELCLAAGPPPLFAIFQGTSNGGQRVSNLRP